MRPASWTWLALAMIAAIGCTASQGVRRDARFEIGRAVAEFAMKNGLVGPVLIEAADFPVNDDMYFMTPGEDGDIPVPEELARKLVRSNAIAPPGAVVRGAKAALHENGLGTVQAVSRAGSRVCIGPMVLASDLSASLVVVGQGRLECGSSVIVYLAPSGKTWVIKGLGNHTVY